MLKVSIHVLSLIFHRAGSSFHSFSMTMTVMSSTKYPDMLKCTEFLSHRSYSMVVYVAMEDQTRPLWNAVVLSGSAW